MFSAQSCEAGQRLDWNTGCVDCPADTWNIAGNQYRDTCEPCPLGKGVGPGLGKQDSDCSWSK